MRIIFILCFTLLSLTVSAQEPLTIINKNTIVTTPQNQGQALSYQVLGNYNYLDFFFNSNNGANFNRFYGHANLYGVGADGFKWRNDILVGLLFFKAYTNTHVTTLLNPGPLSLSAQTLHNDSLYAHVLKQVKPWLAFDLSGSYGVNRLSFNSDLQFFSGQNVENWAKTHGNNWFINGSAIMATKYHDVLISGNVRALFSDVFQDAYTLFATGANVTNQPVPSFSNKSIFILESAEFTYLKNTLLQPFVDVGLIQVAYFSNSRNTVTSVISGPIPAFNLDNNGYNVGGGVMFRRKNTLLRIQEMYYQRGSVYHSNQMSITLQVKVD